jgi:hypothetical protein
MAIVSPSFLPLGGEAELDAGHKIFRQVAPPTSL